jgi:NAD(P)-dependent dehydrogenase (short-subunit alcohol dehydrogenase family)
MLRQQAETGGLVETSTMLVLGGTGSCGRHVVGAALDIGLRVRLLTRRPEQIVAATFAWAQHPQLELVRGDLADADAVARACEGVAAVISLAGATRGARDNVLPQAIRHVVAGMRAAGVRRLIVQVGAFVKLDGEASTLVDRAAKAAFGALMHEQVTLAGNDEVAAFLQRDCADLDWTLTRPGLLDDGPSHGIVETAFDYGPGTPSDHPSKIDLARWTLGLLGDERSFRRAPTVQYAPEDFGFAASRVDGEKRVAVITGANAGLGFETARVLLEKGMRVVCACRDAERGTAAVAELLRRTAGRPDARDDDARFLPLDVSSLASVRAFAAAWPAQGLPLHVLLCNAGIMMGPPRLSVDGVDLQIATNYLGHFLLCQLLREALIASAPARVVHVSSMAARFGSIDVDRLNPDQSAYDSQQVYAASKLMQVVFSRELNERLQGTGVISNSLEPGIVNTGLARGITDDPAMRARIEQGVSVEVGARTSVFLCASMQAQQGGGNYADCQDVSRGLARARYLLAAHSLRRSVGPPLWDASSALIASLSSGAS